MGVCASRFLAAIACVLAIALSGCATVGGGADDAERVNNALTTDDVGFVRGAIQAGTLTPNHRVSTPGYPDGAPLMAIAARAAALEVLRFLISAGADVNARTPVGETPLMLASFFFDETQAATGRQFDRHEAAVRLLIEKGAKVDAHAANGGTYINTPLMMAAIQGHEHIVRTLLRAGADADVRVYGGHTAAEFAAKYNHAALSQLLQCAQRQYGVGATGPHCRQMLGYDPADRQAGSGRR